MFKENMKRFWPISVIGSLVFFLAGPMRMISDGRAHYSTDTVYWALGRNNFVYYFFSFALAITAAMAVYSYLDKSNSAGTIHAMPFSRKRLFLENYGSGLLLAVIPILFNTVLLFVLQKEVTMEVVTDGFVSKIGIYSTTAILLCLLKCITVLFFSYSICVLASMISGNAVIRGLTCGALNFLLPLFTASLTLYADTFLNGFVVGDGLTAAIYHMHPAIALLAYGPNVTAKHYICYFVAALLISGLACFAYTKRPLEKTGDSYVFEFVKYIIAFFLVFFAGTFIGVLFGSVFMGGMPIFPAYLIGSFVGFIIAWMFVNRTFRIFNVKSLLACLIYMALMGVILMSFVFDLFGYAKRTPAASDVQSVTINSSAYNNLLYDSFSDSQLLFKDPENIESIIAYHKEVAIADAPEDGSYGWLDIEYTLKNGKTFKRFFHGIPYALVQNSENLKKAVESDEVMKNVQASLQGMSLKDIGIYSSWANYTDAKNLTIAMYDDAKREGLRAALAADIEEYGQEEMTAARTPLYTISADEKADSYDPYGSQKYHYYYISIYPSYSRTLAWLAENEVGTELNYGLEHNYMILTKSNSAFYDTYYNTVFGDNAVIASPMDGMAVLTEKTMIEDLILNSKSGLNEDLDDVYYVVYMVYDPDTKHYYDNISTYVNINELSPKTQAEILKVM